MPLRQQEREEFLAEPHIAALSVAAGPDRGPLTVPVWYGYSPGGEPWVMTGAGSRKAELIEAAGRFTLMVERLEPTVRYVTVEGPVSHIKPGTDEMMSELAHRYLDGERAKQYLAFAKAELGEHVAIHLQPKHWLSADMGGL